MKTKIKIFTIILFAFPLNILAATLGLSPKDSTVSVGQTFTASIIVDAGAVAINAVSGTLSYPSDYLQVVSLSKSSSIINFWVTEPSFSTASGKIHFEGIVLNPGYSGHSGNILKVTFKPKKVGTATLSFQTSSVLANDGNGTEVLTSTGKATYNIKPATTAPTEINDEPPFKEEEIIIPAPSSVTLVPKEELESPVITNYPEYVKIGDLIAVKGVTYPNMRVIVALAKSTESPGIFGKLTYTSPEHNDYTVKTIIKSDEHGEFSYISPKQVERGTYMLSITALAENGDMSNPSETVTIRVYKTLLMRFGGNAVEILAIVIPLIGLIFMLLWMIFAVFRKFRRLSEDVRIRSKRTEDMVDRSFAVLKDDVGMLEKVPHDKISREERAILNLHKRDLDQAREMIDQNVEDIPPKNLHL